MGQPIHILDLAKNMIHLTGLSVRTEQSLSGDIAISYIGRRLGEKTHEELYYDPSSAKPTRHQKILPGRPAEFSDYDIEAELKKSIIALDKRDEASVRQTLFDIIFKHEDSGNQA